MVDMGCEGLHSNGIAHVGPAHRPESGPCGRRLPEMLNSPQKMYDNAGIH